MELFGEDSSKSKVIEELLDGENLTTVLTNKAEKTFHKRKFYICEFMILVQW